MTVAHDGAAIKVTDLTGADQGWISLCSDALQDRPGELDTLLDRDGPYARVLMDGPSRWPDRPPLAEEAADVPDLSCARAILAVARALVEPAQTVELTSPAVAHWLRANVLPDATDPVQIPDATITNAKPELRSVLQRLTDERGGPALGYTALVAMQLARAFPKAGLTVGMPVLFDRNREGGTGFLALTLLPGGPAGLYPHPAHMAFLVSDRQFAGSLTAAWQGSRLREAGNCVVWTLLDKKTPCNDTVHGSLGGAFGATLDELWRRRRWWSRLNPRRLNPRRAITGGLTAAGQLTSVGGYDAKLKAAKDNRLRVIAPAADREQVQRLPDDLPGLVDHADTLKQALSYARWLSRRQLIIMLLVAVLLVVGGFGGGTVINRLNQDTQRRSELAAKASSLTAQATLKRQTDPRLAALLALASYRLAPGGSDTTNALRDILAGNQTVIRSWLASPTQVGSIAVDEQRGRVFTAGDDDAIKDWSLDTGTLTGQVPGRTGALVLNPRAPVLAANDGDQVRLFDVSGDAPRLLGRLPAATCVPEFQTIVATHFVGLGATLLATWTDGSVSTWDVVTRTLADCWRVRNVATAEQVGTPASGRLVIDSALVPSDQWAAESEDELLILMNHSRVLSFGLRSKRVTVQLDGSEVPAAYRKLRASTDRLAVATQSGVLLWDRAKRRTIAYPAGGFGAVPEAIDLYDGKLLVAGADGTVVVPALTNESGTARISTQPHGGAATVAAFGTKGTVVAGGPGGRISVLRETGGTLTLPSITPASAAAFAPNGTLLMNNWSEGRSNQLYTIRTSDPPAYVSPAGSTYPHVVEYGAQTPFYVNNVAASPDHVAAVGQTRQGAAVLVWPAGGGAARELPVPTPDDAVRKFSEQVATHVAFVPGTNLMLARHVSGQVVLWDTGSFEQVGTLDLKGGTTAMDVNGTRGVFAEGAESATDLVQVDLLTRKELGRVHAPDTYRIVWSADGATIVTLTWGNELRVYDRGLKPVGSAWRLPEGTIANDIRLSPNGRQVAVAQGTRVLVYDVSTHAESMPPLEDVGGNEVIRLEWSPDAALVVGLSKTEDRQRKAPGPVDLWVVRDADWTTQVCRWTGGGLTRAQWDEYVGATADFIDLCAGVTR